MQVEDIPLELDESELFEEEEDSSPASGVPPPNLHSPAELAALSALPQATDGESESDDDGIVLESECSSSEDEVDGDLSNRIQSLVSSSENPAPLQEQPLGTSHSSEVGSLKSFGAASFRAKRLFGSEGDLAISMPVHSTAPMMAVRRRVMPLAAEKQQASNLGTSMPISIPMMQRRSSAADLLVAEMERAAPATFVPPHMLHQESSELSGLLSTPGLDGGLSPTAAAKREKLLARNAILRSTGFIEVQRPPTMSEVLDPVKDQLLGTLAAAAPAVPVAVPGVMLRDVRTTPRSSLTQMLGTSK